MPADAPAGRVSRRARLPGWPLARDAFRGTAEPLAEPAKRPAPILLAPAERRRAPDPVALALEVATRAVELAGAALAASW